MREKLTLENMFMFEKKQTRSILNLLIEFQDKEFQGKKGLRQMHFRYALEKEYGTDEQINSIKKDEEFERNIGRMKDFFGDRLDYMIQKRLIEKGCINNRQLLNYYLDQLGGENLKIITKSGNGKKARYFLKQGAYSEGIRIQNKNILDDYNIKKIVSVQNEILRKHIIYGLSNEIYQKHKLTIDEKIRNVESLLKEIEEVKRKTWNEQWKDRIKKFCEEIKNIKIEKAFNENFWYFIGTFERGIVLIAENRKPTWEEYLLYATEFVDNKDVHGKIPQPLWDEIKHTLKRREEGKLTEDDYTRYRKIWSEVWFGKDYKFTFKEIKQIVDWAWKYVKDEYEYHPFGIAFSRYDIQMPNPFRESISK